MNAPLPPIPRLESARLLIEMPTLPDAERVRSFYERNRDFFHFWEPDHGEHIYTREFWQTVLPSYREEFERGQAVRVVLRRKDDLRGPIIGFIHYTQMIGGALMSCSFGCNLDAAAEGKGYMTEAARAMMEYLFGELQVHRINATYMPSNLRSMRLMRRLGFTVEGYAKDYLFVNGCWRDHVISSVVNPAHAAQSDTFENP